MCILVWIFKLPVGLPAGLLNWIESDHESALCCSSLVHVAFSQLVLRPFKTRNCIFIPKIRCLSLHACTSGLLNLFAISLFWNISICKFQLFIPFCFLNISFFVTAALDFILLFVLIFRSCFTQVIPTVKFFRFSPCLIIAWNSRKMHLEICSVVVVVCLNCIY